MTCNNQNVCMFNSGSLRLKIIKSSRRSYIIVSERKIWFEICERRLRRQIDPELEPGIETR